MKKLNNYEVCDVRWCGPVAKYQSHFRLLPTSKGFIVNISTVTKVAIAFVGLVLLSSCGNTIRGMGRDTANTVNATQDAGRSVDRAAKN